MTNQNEHQILIYHYIKRSLGPLHVFTFICLFINLFLSILYFVTGSYRYHQNSLSNLNKKSLKKDKATGRRWCELAIESIWGIRNGEVYT